MGRRTDPSDARRCAPAAAVTPGDRSPRGGRRSVPAHGKCNAAGDIGPSARRPRRRHGRGWRIAFGRVGYSAREARTRNPDVCSALDSEFDATRRPGMTKVTKTHNEETPMKAAVLHEV